MHQITNGKDGPTDRCRTFCSDAAKRILFAKLNFAIFLFLSRFLGISGTVAYSLVWTNRSHEVHAMAVLTLSVNFSHPSREIFKSSSLSTRPICGKSATSLQALLAIHLLMKQTSRDIQIEERRSRQQCRRDSGDTLPFRNPPRIRPKRRGMNRFAFSLAA